MASIGPNSPTAAAQIVATWNSVTNVYSSNNSRADSSSTSAIMAATGFAFSIPGGATIDGITVEVEGYGSGSQAARRGLTASLTKDGSTLAGTRGAQIDMTTTNPETDYKTWGGSSSLWGTTWSTTEVNATTFGVLLQPSGTTNYVRYVDHVRVTITYTVVNKILIDASGALSPETLGNSTSSESHYHAYGENYIYGFPFTLAHEGTVSLISLYCKATSGSMNVQCGIYDNSSPRNRKAYTSTVSVSISWAWRNFSVVSSPAILPAGDYYLCFNGNTAGLNVSYSINATYVKGWAQTYGTWPTTIEYPGTDFGSQGKISEYALVYYSGFQENIDARRKISISDSPSGGQDVIEVEDMVAKTPISVPDTGSGADALTFILRRTNLADVGSGTDILAIRAMLSSITDIGSGVDALRKGIKETEVGSSIDTLRKGMRLSDVGSGADTLRKGTLIPETGSGADALRKGIHEADSGAGADTLRKGIRLPDSGTSVDTPLVKAGVPLVDIGAGLDAVSVYGGITPKTIDDSGSGSDAIPTITARVPISDISIASSDVPTIREKLAPILDTGSGSDLLALRKKLASIPDSGSGVDVITKILASVSLTDVGAGIDTVTNILRKIFIIESGAGTDLVTSILRKIFLTDTGAGIDLITNILRKILIAESGAGSDTITDILRKISIIESGMGVDVITTILARLGITDVGAGDDTIFVSTSIPLKEISDSGSGSDTLAIRALVVIGDSGLGIETKVGGVWVGCALSVKVSGVWKSS